MNIHNIAFVRSFKENEFKNIIKNGSMKTEKKLTVLKPEQIPSSDFACGFDSALRSNHIYDYTGIPETFDEYKTQTGDEDFEKYQDLKAEARRKQTPSFFPLHADYNGQLLWAINGLVPDDSETNAFANNTFSTNSYAIICGIEELLSQESATIVSLHPTDAAIEGELKLDSSFTLCIRQSKFNTLTDSERQKLFSTGLRVKLFDGDLRKAVAAELISSDRFVSETPTLIREMNGFKDSPTKQETLSVLHQISEEHKIPIVDHFSMAKKEMDDYYYVGHFYSIDFIRFLEASKFLNENGEQYTYYLLEHYTSGYSENFAQLIIDQGRIDDYKKLVKQYNENLLALNEKGLLPTPEKMLEARDKGELLTVYTLFNHLKTQETQTPSTEGPSFDDDL